MTFSRHFIQVLKPGLHLCVFLLLLLLCLDVGSAPHTTGHDCSRGHRRVQRGSHTARKKLKEFFLTKQQQQQKMNNMNSKLCWFNIWLKAATLHSNPTVFALEMLYSIKTFRGLSGRQRGERAHNFQKWNFFFQLISSPKWGWGLD